MACIYGRIFSEPYAAIEGVGEKMLTSSVA